MDNATELVVKFDVSNYEWTATQVSGEIPHPLCSIADLKCLEIEDKIINADRIQFVGGHFVHVIENIWPNDPPQPIAHMVLRSALIAKATGRARAMKYIFTLCLLMIAATLTAVGFSKAALFLVFSKPKAEVIRAQEESIWIIGKKDVVADRMHGGPFILLYRGDKEHKIKVEGKKRIIAAFYTLDDDIRNITQFHSLDLKINQEEGDVTLTAVPEINEQLPGPSGGVTHLRVTVHVLTSGSE
jgi:hypothetical protein